MLYIVILIKSIIHPGIKPFMTDIIDPGIMHIGCTGQFQFCFYPFYTGKIGRSPSTRYLVRIIKATGIRDRQTVFIFQVKVKCTSYIMRQAYKIIPVILFDII